MDGAALVLEKVNYNYHSNNGETAAIVDVDFTVNAGDFVAIVGPSGCGKSTLLSLISGLLQPSSGTITVFGTQLSKNFTSANSRIGYMLQQDHLFNWRTIKQNAVLGLEIQHKLNKEAETYVDTLLERYGLADFADSRPNQLSGGMRQRAALIRTLAVSPDILLLDEAFSALDYQTRLTVSDEIGTIIRKEGKTAIMVTHDISEAIAMSDHVIMLSKRPASVKNIFTIDIPGSCSLERRKSPLFAEYFNSIWKELDVNV